MCNICASNEKHCDCGCIYNDRNCPNCNLKSPQDRIKELENKLRQLSRAIKNAYEEGYIDGRADGWVNNPSIEKEWKNSMAYVQAKGLK